MLCSAQLPFLAQELCDTLLTATSAPLSQVSCQEDSGPELQYLTLGTQAILPGVKMMALSIDDPL